MKRISKSLYAELQERMAVKKSVLKCVDAPDIILIATKDFMFDFLDPADNVTKATKYLFENDEEKGILKRTIVANAYNWMDSHGDVHLDATFARSLQGRGKTAPHLHDHKFELNARVGKPIKFEERMLSWRELGASKTGKTMCLVMESEIRRSMNEAVYLDYLNNEVNQHSVCMQYVDIKLAADDEEEYPKEYALWKKVLPLLGNRKEAEDQGYFFVVSEAKLIEVSAVLMGANELTPTLGQKPSPDTSETEEEKTRLLGTQLQAEKQDMLRRLQKSVVLNDLKSIV